MSNGSTGGDHGANPSQGGDTSQGGGARGWEGESGGFGGDGGGGGGWDLYKLRPNPTSRSTCI